jgi:hypothetical protein
VLFVTGCIRTGRHHTAGKRETKVYVLFGSLVFYTHDQNLSRMLFIPIPQETSSMYVSPRLTFLTVRPSCFQKVIDDLTVLSMKCGDGHYFSNFTATTQSRFEGNRLMKLLDLKRGLLARLSQSSNTKFGCHIDKETIGPVSIVDVIIAC